jgi:Ferredoxin-like domain in Api92-like protein
VYNDGVIEMPNNCENRVTIIGHKEDLDLFEEKGLAFSYFCPMPENGDIEWCSENWGTKWDPYNLKSERNGPNGIEFNFTTAWGPPIVFLKKLLSQYPKCWIKITYGECMMMLAGIWIGYMKNGELKEKWLEWIEPMPILTTAGEVLCE